MFLKPYRIEIWVPIGITVKDVFSFSVNNFILKPVLKFFPISCKLKVIGNYTLVVCDV